jgi:hypothetical protein
VERTLYSSRTPSFHETLCGLGRQCSLNSKICLLFVHISRISRPEIVLADMPSTFWTYNSTHRARCVSGRTDFPTDYLCSSNKWTPWEVGVNLIGQDGAFNALSVLNHATESKRLSLYARVMISSVLADAVSKSKFRNLMCM